MKQLKRLAKRLLGYGTGADYRAVLFSELRTYLGATAPRRILEIGPKDGQDTRRLLQLGPERLTLIDLPRMKETNERWLRDVDAPALEYISANVMYSDAVQSLDPYDVVWCTGVLYHNPEQLRMIRLLSDLLKPGGVLVLESATIRRRSLRDQNCVEILYPPSEAVKRKYHISLNVTHLPSARAVEAWLGMVGFERIVRAGCHRSASAALARARAAYLATKPVTARSGAYYELSGEEGFEVGRAR
jgi:SAM-dependent methyltransferase